MTMRKLNNQEASAYLREIFEAFKRLVDLKRCIYIENVYKELLNIEWHKALYTMGPDYIKYHGLEPMTKREIIKLIEKSDNLESLTRSIYHDKYLRKAKTETYYDDMCDTLCNWDNGNPFIELDSLDDLIWGSYREEFDTKLHDQIKEEMEWYYDEDDAWIKEPEDYYTFMSQFARKEENNLKEFEEIINPIGYLEDMLRTTAVDKAFLLKSLDLI